MLSILLTSDTQNMTSWTLIILLLIPGIFLPDTGWRSVQSCPKPHQIRAPYCIALWPSCSDPNHSPQTSCIGPYRTAFCLIHRNTNWESTNEKYVNISDLLWRQTSRDVIHLQDKHRTYAGWRGGGSSKTCKTSSANCSKMQKRKWEAALQTL